MKRYFIVMYSRSVRGRRIIGECAVVTNNGKYISRNHFEDEAKRQKKSNNIIITNIIELTESDYADWNANN